ncbi:MAG: response regulator transcription factor [Spirochaetaceae bacterium]
MDNNNVLIVEDVPEIAKIISTNIEDLGLKTTHMSDGKSGLLEALSGKYTLIILDLMLPKLDGISICSKIRENDSLTPILILTAKGDEIDRILGLELGADDYMTKPFSVRELVARVKALLRRSRTTNKFDEMKSLDEIEINDIKVDFKNRKVILRGLELELTVKEFDLLSLFIKNPGRTFSRKDLLERIWGYQFEGYEHTVNTHINRLRNKIEDDASNPNYLKTVWGIGYKFNDI